MGEGIAGENSSKGSCLKSSEVVCSESSEDNRSMFSSDGKDESMRNMGIGPPLVRSRRSRVVMGARSVGRERRSSLLMDEKRSSQEQETFVFPEIRPEKELSNRKKFIRWMRRLSGKKEKNVEEELVTASVKDKVVTGTCETCEAQEISEEQRSWSHLPGSHEVKVQSLNKKCYCLIHLRLCALMAGILFFLLTLIRPEGEVSGEEVKQGGEEILK